MNYLNVSNSKIWLLQFFSMSCLLFTLISCEQEEDTQNDISLENVSSIEYEDFLIANNLDKFNTVVYNNTLYNLTPEMSKLNFTTLKNIFQIAEEISYVEDYKTVLVNTSKTDIQSFTSDLESTVEKFNIQSETSPLSTNDVKARRATSYFWLEFYEKRGYKGRKLRYSWGSKSRPIYPVINGKWRNLSERRSVPKWFNDKMSSYKIQYVSKNLFSGALNLYGNANYKKKFGINRSFSGTKSGNWYYGGYQEYDAWRLQPSVPWAVPTNNNMNSWVLRIKQ